MLLGLVEPDGRHAPPSSAGRSRRSPTRAHGRRGLLDGGMLHPGRSGRNHLRALGRGRRLADARVDELLELVGAHATPPHRRAGGYSLGMRQRLGLAAALLGDPQVLVLDEPANGLDPQGIRWLRDFLRALAAEGRTVLVSSHVLAEVAQTVDDVVVINRGRMVTSGPIVGLVTEGAVRVRSPRAAELAAALERDGAEVTADGGALEVKGRTTEQVGDLAYTIGVPVHELALETASLEDVFFRLTAEEPVT